MCIYKDMNKNIKFKRQMKSTLNSRESKLRKKSYTLEIICLHYFILDESSFFLEMNGYLHVKT